MTPDHELIKHIICLHCKHNLELSQGPIGDGDECAALVKCGRDGWYKHLRTKCPGYKADCLKQPEQGDCEKCSPINRGWCYGDCEKCANHDEWKEWAK